MLNSHMKSMLLMLAAAGSMVMAGTVYAADAGGDLAKAKGCLGCHDVAVKKVGPAYKDYEECLSDARGKGYEFQPAQAKRVPGQSR